jgi:hypothetical protein
MIIGQNIGKPDSYTKLLISGRNPANIKDIATGKVITNVGSVAFQSTYKKLNPNALSFNGSSQRLTLNNSEDWNFRSGNFTIDLWCRWIVVTDNKALIGKDSGGATYDWAFILYGGHLRFYYTTDGTTWKYANSGWIPTVNIWYHTAVVRNGTVLKIFVNGTQQGSNYNISTDNIYV